MEAEPSFEPLERVAAVMAAVPVLPAIRPEEFLYIGRLAQPDGPDVHVFKHVATRRCLNLDDVGHTYRFCGAVACRDGLGGRYEPYRDLGTAMAHLGLCAPRAVSSSGER